MLSRLREHFGTAGLVVAIMALVAALAGGAIAANGGSDDGQATASAKGKQGPRGKTGKTGKTGPQGPAGPAGPQGPAGPKGDTGAPGSNGTNGTNGATGATGATGKNGAAGTPGEPGEPWTVGNVLPPEATETGVWRFVANTDEFQYVPISFPIPLAPADADSITYKALGKENPPTTECPGNVEDPKAAPGYLCVYVSPYETNFLGTPSEIYPPTFDGSEDEGEVTSSGTLLYFETPKATDRSSGSFAVTAPAP